MSSFRRTTVIALALLLCATNAFANAAVEDDAAVVDASTVLEDDGGTGTATGGPKSNVLGPDAQAPTSDAPPATNAVLADASPSSPSVTFPSATGERYTAPEFAGDDGCRTASSSSGSLSTVALGLCAFLALAWSRRRRDAR